jgi:hypothetical protein
VCGPRLIAGLVALTALLQVPAASAAKHPPPPAPQLDTATATGHNLIIDDFSSTDIDVDAHSGPSGENPGGHVSFVAGGILPVSGPVTCLDVSGNTAVMTVAGPFPSAPGFTAFIVRLVDNGGSGLDRFEYFPDDPEVPEPLDCRIGSSDYFGGLLIGRALVKDVDAPAPVPTSRKQCRHGGFAQFGFRNKRQCIRYVIRHRHRGGAQGNH